MTQIDFSALLSQQSPKVLLAFLLAISVSTVFAFIFSTLFQWYADQGHSGMGVNKSFLLIAPAVTAIFLVIQFSLPLSLGLLGALSFVRFRTPIKEPEEIGFILVVIASSLSCAVFRFEVGALLMLMVLALCVLRNKFGWWKMAMHSSKVADLFIRMDATSSSSEASYESVTKEIQTSFKSSELVSLSKNEGGVLFHFKIREDSKKSNLASLFIDKLRAMRFVQDVNLVYQQ